MGESAHHRLLPAHSALAMVASALLDAALKAPGRAARTIVSGHVRSAAVVVLVARASITPVRLVAEDLVFRPQRHEVLMAVKAQQAKVPSWSDLALVAIAGMAGVGLGLLLPEPSVSFRPRIWIPAILGLLVGWSSGASP
jgi:hypothetical protein